jgi:uncharacterized protein YunC (DUF1805 family)
VECENWEVLQMVTLEAVQVGDYILVGVEVKLPKTTLLSISTSRGYIMCGALDIGLLNETLSDRQIIAARAVGVRTLPQLLAAPLESVTIEAEKLGIVPGMTGAEALLLMV